MIKKALDFVSSYGVACVLLTLLLILVLFGTLEQADQGLYQVQKKYFESNYVVHHLFGTIPILLPGVYLILTLLSVNIICGAIVRAPKNIKRPGMLIAHGGIILMIAAGFVTYNYSTNGRMMLYEGDQSSEYESYYEWEIRITEYGEGDTARQWVIPHEVFADMKPSDTREFYAAGLPFELELTGFLHNANPLPMSMAGAGVDGVMLSERALSTEAEMNIAGAYATLKGKDGAALAKSVLWGFDLAPWIATMEGKDYTIRMQHKRWEVPFTIVLNDFIHDMHPGTSMAANYESVVTKIENGVAREVNIRMNEPLRHEGYTFFQASWGPQNAGPNEPLFSVFAVVKNPADQWPLYSCIVIAIGLMIHFMQKLFVYIRAENRRRTA